jgi:tetratricopeptide (TPR) repeat protein
LNSQFPGAHYNLGLAYLLNEGATAVANAEEEFKMELAANPNDFFSNYYLGITCIFQRKWELAVDYLKTASRIQPNNPDPYFQLGQVYQELKKHDQAIDVLTKAIDLNPNLPHNKFQVTTAHYRLAQSLLQTGQTEAGRKELQVASELKARAFETTQKQAMGVSRVPDENYQTPQASLDQKTRSELEANETQLTKIISALHNSLGLVQAGRQNLTGAAVEFRLAKKWNPQQVGLDYNLGLAYFRSELYRDALAPLESEIKANPANTQARWLLGLSYFHTSGYAKAVELLHDVLTSESTNVELWYGLASSLIRQQQIDTAEHANERMTVLTAANPNNVRLAQVRYELGKALLQQANVAGAISNLEIAVKLEPENALFHYELGRAYTAAGRREEGKRENETFNRLKKQPVAGQTPQ